MVTPAFLTFTPIPQRRMNIIRTQRLNTHGSHQTDKNRKARRWPAFPNRIHRLHLHFIINLLATGFNRIVAVFPQQVLTDSVGPRIWYCIRIGPERSVRELNLTNRIYVCQSFWSRDSVRNIPNSAAHAYQFNWSYDCSKALESQLNDINYEIIDSWSAKSSLRRSWVTTVFHVYVELLWGLDYL